MKIQFTYDNVSYTLTDSAAIDYMMVCAAARIKSVHKDKAHKVFTDLVAGVVPSKGRDSLSERDKALLDVYKSLCDKHGIDLDWRKSDAMTQAVNSLSKKVNKDVKEVMDIASKAADAIVAAGNVDL